MVTGNAVNFHTFALLYVFSHLAESVSGFATGDPILKHSHWYLELSKSYRLYSEASKKHIAIEAKKNFLIICPSLLTFSIFTPPFSSQVVACLNLHEVDSEMEQCKQCTQEVFPPLFLLN